MSSTKYRQIGMFVNPADLGNLTVYWEGRPSKVPFMVFRSDLLQYILLSVLVYFLVTDTTSRYAIIIGCAICCIYSIIKSSRVRYMITDGGLIFRTLFRTYCVPWNNISKVGKTRIIDQFRKRSYIFAGEYQVAHSKNAYLTYATMWYIKDYEHMVSILKKYAKINRMDSKEDIV